MELTLLYFDGCPSWRTTDQRLRDLADELGFQTDYRKVDSPEAAAVVVGPLGLWRVVVALVRMRN